MRTPMTFFSMFLFFVCWAVLALREHHMHQLCSYKAGMWMRRLRENFVREYLCRRVCVPFLIAASLAGPGRLAGLAWGFLCASQTALDWPRRAKKPLVFTGRMKRMLASHALLAAGAVACAFRGPPPWRGVSAAALLLLTPLFVLLSNLLNAPVERAINRRYIEDAKRVLRGMPRLIVVGVTGSYGKTSVKNFLRSLLSPKYNVAMTPESYNTTLGVVRAVRELSPIHEVFVCEMGARNVGDVKEICDIVKPRYGVITAVGPQHLESFGTIERVLKAKFELADALPEDGAAFLNRDDERIRAKEREKMKARVVSYGLSPGADYAASDIRVSASGSSFRVALPGAGRHCRFETKLIGKHNVRNLLAAIAVADRLGVDPDDMVLAVRRIEPVPHRTQILRAGGNPAGGNMILIDDAYNANESGAEAALETLALFEGLKILVTPGMVELGKEQDGCNRRFGRRAAEVCDFVLLVGKRQTQSVAEGLRDGGFPDEKVFAAPTLEWAFEKIAELGAGSPKVILLENDLPDNY
jgi:UDP-N-acetylmuramoyl-tripeptide--D-alanyl-D-alanine ligase